MIRVMLPWESCDPSRLLSDDFGNPSLEAPKRERLKKSDSILSRDKLLLWPSSAGKELSGRAFTHLIRFSLRKVNCHFLSVAYFILLLMNCLRRWIFSPRLFCYSPRCNEWLFSPRTINRSVLRNAPENYTYQLL